MDIEVKKNYTQLKDQQIFHSIFEELRRNDVIGLDKCPHNNDQPIKNCLDCIDEKELYQQLEIIHEPLFQSIPNKETDLTEKQ